MVPIADVIIIILAVLIMGIPWFPAKGRFTASAIVVVVLWGMVMWCDNATWLHWIEFLRTYWFALILPFLVFIIGIFASKTK